MPRAFAISIAILQIAFGVSPAGAEEPVRGVIRAAREATLSSELNARITELPIKEGDRFRTGSLLVAFDCGKYDAELKAAEAELKTHEITLLNGVALQKRGALGGFENDLNRARVDKAKAAVDGLQVRIADCRIEAPFGGRAAEIKVRRYELLAPNTPLMRIVDDSMLEIDFIVPSTWLAWLTVGMLFRVKVDETSTWHDAKVLRLPATVDAVSQTAKITGGFSIPSVGTLPGMSVTAQFSRAGG